MDKVLSFHLDNLVFISEIVSSQAFIKDILSKDLSKSLFGRVKQFASLANTRKAVSNEGFPDIKIQYMGELWVLLEFVSEDSMKLFQDNVEGIPFKLWSDNTFMRITTKWGELLDIDDQDETAFWIRAKEAPGWVPDFIEENDDEEHNDDGGFNVHESGSCAGDSDVEGVLETIFEESGQKENNLDEEHTDKKENHSRDPFSIYKLLKKKKDNVEKENNSKHSMKYPPEVNNTFSGNCPKQNSNEDVSNSVCSGHFKTSMVPRTGGSFMSLMDELVKIEMEGFSKVVEDAWMEGPCDESNAMINMMIKLKYIKTKIREWNKKNMLSAKNVKAKYKDELEALEAIIDKGDGNVEVVNKRIEVVNTLQKIDKICSSEMVQKAKVKCRFDKPDARRAHIEMRYLKTLTCDQHVELESDVSNEEIKKAVWDCGIDKSPGPDGFTFVHVLECFYRASGLRINMSKSKIMGVLVDSDKVKCAALKLGCLILKTSFSYLGSKLGGSMSRVHTWNQVIKAIHGDDGKVGGYVKNGAKSCWLSIVNEINSSKIKEQFDELSALVHDVTLNPMSDRWIWALESSGDFSVASVRKVIDDKSFPKVDSKTRWIKYVPIKVNVHAWKVNTDSLSTRFNVSRHGIHIDSIMCAICDKGAETSSHLFSHAAWLDKLFV
nr:nucleotide-binding alpha-beta plait domain-containing protein [Tanacetum cinerariifolium]